MNDYSGFKWLSSIHTSPQLVVAVIWERSLTYFPALSLEIGQLNVNFSLVPLKITKWDVMVTHFFATSRDSISIWSLDLQPQVMVIAGTTRWPIKWDCMGWPSRRLTWSYERKSAQPYPSWLRLLHGVVTCSPTRLLSSPSLTSTGNQEHGLMRGGSCARYGLQTHLCPVYFTEQAQICIRKASIYLCLPEFYLLILFGFLVENFWFWSWSCSLVMFLDLVFFMVLSLPCSRVLLVLKRWIYINI